VTDESKHSMRPSSWSGWSVVGRDRARRAKLSTGPSIGVARGRSKAAVEHVNKQPDEQQQVVAALLSRVTQLEVGIVVAEQKRQATEAELKQSLTEVRFELRRLQESHESAVHAVKELREEVHQLRIKNVADDSDEQHRHFHELGVRNTPASTASRGRASTDPWT